MKIWYDPVSEHVDIAASQGLSSFYNAKEMLEMMCQICDTPQIKVAQKLMKLMEADCELTELASKGTRVFTVAVDPMLPYSTAIEVYGLGSEPANAAFAAITIEPHSLVIEVPTTARCETVRMDLFLRMVQLITPLVVNRRITIMSGEVVAAFAQWVLGDELEFVVDNLHIERSGDQLPGYVVFTANW